MGMQDTSERVGIFLFPRSLGRLPTGRGETRNPTEGDTGMRRDSSLRTSHSRSNNINNIIISLSKYHSYIMVIIFFLEALSFEALGKLPAEPSG